MINTNPFFPPLCQAIVALTLKTQKSLNAVSSTAATAAATSSKDVTLLELESALLARLQQIVVKRILGKGREYPRGETLLTHDHRGITGFQQEMGHTLEACVRMVIFYLLFCCSVVSVFLLFCCSVVLLFCCSVVLFFCFFSF